MLPRLLAVNHAAFDALASAWIDLGAKSFSIWANDQLLEHWESGRSNISRILVSPIEQDGQKLGELRVAIGPNPTAQNHLDADASLISGLIPLSRDLEIVTGELIETRDQLLAFYNLSHSCRNCFSIDEILSALVREITSLARTEHAFIAIKQDGISPLTAQHPHPHYAVEDLDRFTRLLGEQEHLLYQEGNASFLLVPVRVNEAQSSSLRGIIGLVNKAGGEFKWPDIKLARALAAQSAVQIENMLLVQSQVQFARMQTEMELAQRVQTSLLPKEVPSLPGIEIWAATHPALQVGGDFFDFIMKPGWPFTFVVGDLSGKGFPAALLMAMTRMMIRAEMNHASTPEKILSDTNCELYDDFNNLSSFATLFIGQYLPERREILFANAGHSPVIHLRHNEQPRLMFADGTALGILPVMQSKDHCIELQPGDWLIVGTDGLTDEVNLAGERFGYDHLLALIGSLAHTRPADMAARIFHEISTFSGNSINNDDQTLVLIHSTG